MIPDKLFAQVKRKLNITWEDSDTDARVADIAASADAHLRYLLLFLARCFYEWNHALDEFDANYRPLIMQARAKYEAKQWGEEDGAENASN